MEVQEAGGSIFRKFSNWKKLDYKINFLALPVKVVDQLESMEQKKETDVILVRLENMKLRNKLRRHEQLLRQKVGIF